MKYQGSKDKIAKYIIPFLVKDREIDQWYVEPFVGGANLIDKIHGNRIGADVNKYLIAALILIRDNPESLPNLITESDYKNIRSTGNIGLIGYIGFTMSFGAKFFGGYRREKKGDKGNLNNMKYQTIQSKKSAISQSSKIKGVKFVVTPYHELEIPKNSIIYCDPPYKDTTEYSKKNFNHPKFWDWCRTKRDESHKIFISEYQAPDDFVDIWQMEKVSSLSKDTGSKKGREKLFVHKDDYKNQFHF